MTDRHGDELDERERDVAEQSRRAYGEQPLAENEAWALGVSRHALISHKLFAVVPDPPPADFRAWLDRRHRQGGDRHDEVWGGVLRMVAIPSGAHVDVQQQLAKLLDPPCRAAGLYPQIGAINIGEPDDYRVSDGAIQREQRSETWHPTAALIIEIASPGDETWNKLSFYAAHGVDELLIIDPQEQSVDWFALRGNEYQPVARSHVINMDRAELAEQIDWS